MHFLPVFIITRIFKKTNYNNDNKKSNHQWSSLNHGTLNFNDILNDYVARVYTENKVKLFILSFVYPLPQILQRLCFYNIFFFLNTFCSNSDDQFEIEAKTSIISCQKLYKSQQLDMFDIWVYNFKIYLKISSNLGEWCLTLGLIGLIICFNIICLHWWKKIHRILEEKKSWSCFQECILQTTIIYLILNYHILF